MSKISAQSYYRAATMSSQKLDNPTKIKERTLQEFHVHCIMHVLIFSTSCIKSAECMWKTLGVFENIIVFVTDGSKSGCLFENFKNKQFLVT